MWSGDSPHHGEVGDGPLHVHTSARSGVIIVRDAHRRYEPAAVMAVILLWEVPALARLEHGVATMYKVSLSNVEQ